MDLVMCAAHGPQVFNDGTSCCPNCTRELDTAPADRDSDWCARELGDVPVRERSQICATEVDCVHGAGETWDSILPALHDYIPRAYVESLEAW